MYMLFSWRPIGVVFVVAIRVHYLTLHVLYGNLAFCVVYPKVVNVSVSCNL